MIDGSLECGGSGIKGVHSGDLDINGSMLIGGSGTFELNANNMRIDTNATLVLGDGTIQDMWFTANFINRGQIQKINGVGDFILDVDFENRGIINVLAGSLITQRDFALVDGTYNVGSGSSLWTAGGCEIPGAIMDTLTGVLDGPFILDHWIRPPWGGVVTLDFTGTAGVEWAGGDIEDGDVVNEGLLSITGTGLLTNRLNGITLVNKGTVDITSSEDLRLVFVASLHNTAAGVINLLGETIIVGGPGVSHIINDGSIVKPATGKNVQIFGDIENNASTIDVLGDSLIIGGGSSSGSSATLFCQDGVYNVAAGATLLQQGSWMLNGVASGQLDGPLVLKGGPVYPSLVDTGVFNFTGAEQVQWQGAQFINGTFMNLSTMHAVDATYFPITHTDFINHGLIRVDGTFGMTISNTASLLNSEQGVILIQSDNHLSCGSNGLTNYGLIEKTDSIWSSLISGAVHHYAPGVIRVRQGTLRIDDIRSGDGAFSGGGVLDIANYTVQGDVFPGNSPGTLSMTGDYSSSATAVLNVELDGTVQGTGYDVLAIDDNGVLKGDIVVTMGYAAQVNDQFEIVTASNVDTCLLPSTVTSVYNGDLYTFDVICNSDNVTLGLISVGVEEYTDSQVVRIYPNPTTGILNVETDTPDELFIYQLEGQLVRMDRVGPGSTQVDVTDLSAGVYVLRTASGLTSQLVIVE